LSGTRASFIKQLGRSSSLVCWPHDVGKAACHLSGSRRFPPMRALVVTPFPPPGPKDVQAMFRRLGTFISALGMVADAIEMLHFVPAGAPIFAIDHRTINEAQSARWGTSVAVTLAPARPVKQITARYALGLISGISHPIYAPFAGSHQAAALDDCLDR